MIGSAQVILLMNMNIVFVPCENTSNVWEKRNLTHVILEYERSHSNYVYLI